MSHPDAARELAVLRQTRKTLLVLVTEGYGPAIGPRVPRSPGTLKAQRRWAQDLRRQVRRQRQRVRRRWAQEEKR